MISAPLPENEAERLRWLERLRILDTLEEQAYDDLTFLAAQICGVPIALVSLVDRDRQWFKSHHGLDARETPREYAFCAHAILNDEPFVVENADTDTRFADNPLVTGGPLVKFYAGAPLVLRDGVRLGTLCVIDHHAHQLSPDQLQALQALARQVVSQLELRLQLQELTKLDRAKDEFISVVSHEMRTPLTSMKGSLGLLSHQMKEEVDPLSRNLSEIALRNTERLLAIVNDILDVAKLESGTLQLTLAPLDFSEVARRAVELNRHYAENCRCAIDLRLPDESAERLMVEGDEQRIVQVLNNLLSNAAKFTREGDTVLLHVEPRASEVWVGVTDHGPGIPPERHAEIFTRFAQFSGNTKLPGTGLGLNICKHIVELHGGMIGFSSTPGEETTFYCTLPRRKGQP